MQFVMHHASVHSIIFSTQNTTYSHICYAPRTKLSSLFYFLTLQVPYIIILGGTDVNICLENSDMKSKMENVMHHASSIVAFNHILRDKLCAAIPSLTEKICIIAQSCGVSVSSATSPLESTTAISTDALAAISARDSTPAIPSCDATWRIRLGTQTTTSWCCYLPASGR